MIKKFYLSAYFLLIAMAIWFLPSFCHKQTEGFTFQRIHSRLSFDPKWEIPSLRNINREELDHIFSQSFSYLGSGGQCFVFESEDGQHVIKFSKNHVSELHSFWLKVPLPEPLKSLRSKRYNKLISRLHRDFTSYKIAFENLKNETGLVFVHLNKSDHLKKTITIRDKLGIPHQINLDAVEFVVQKKAALVYPHINNLMQEGKIELAKNAVDTIFELIIARSQKGIYDEDAQIYRNFGFIDNQAVLIDVGRLRFDINRQKPSVYRKDLEHIAKPFQEWLELQHPELGSYFKQKLSAGYVHHTML